MRAVIASSTVVAKIEIYSWYLTTPNLPNLIAVQSMLNGLKKEGGVKAYLMNYGFEPPTVRAIQMHDCNEYAGSSSGSPALGNIQNDNILCEGSSTNSVDKAWNLLECRHLKMVLMVEAYGIHPQKIAKSCHAQRKHMYWKAFRLFFYKIY